jgi:hypothetical protein
LADEQEHATDLRQEGLNVFVVFAGDDPKAVMLDLMQPLVAGRQLIGFDWIRASNGGSARF